MPTSPRRTDPHTLAHLDPDAYTLLTAFDNEPERDCDDFLDSAYSHGRGSLAMAEAVAAQVEHARDAAEHWRTQLAHHAMSDGHWNTTPDGGRCDHCGARIRYVAILRHQPTGQLLPVGQQCLDNRFTADATEHLDRLRGQAAVRRERVAYATQRQQWIDADPRHRQAADYLNAYTGDNPFVSDVAARWRQSSTTHLTPRQVQALLAARDRETARAAERASRATLPPAPEGTLTVTGTVQHAELRDAYHGLRVEFKIIIVTDEGHRIWLTAPAALTTAAQRDHRRMTGRRLTLTADLTRSDRDPHFAFARRPRKVTIHPDDSGQSSPAATDRP